MWKEDLSAALADDLGKDAWEAFRSKVKSAHDIGEVKDIYKCTLFIQQLLADAWDEGKQFPTLGRLGKAIMKYAQSQLGATASPSVEATGTVV